ncbi:MAG: hypothetical protein DRI61_01310 [Chloroflexi bacterium]|nr:MAG: hypothetical protein DRI61_01310 [Chloroflexota bacterium]
MHQTKTNSQKSLRARDDGSPPCKHEILIIKNSWIIRSTVVQSCDWNEIRKKAMELLADAVGSEGYKWKYDWDFKPGNSYRVWNWAWNVNLVDNSLWRIKVLR